MSVLIYGEQWKLHHCWQTCFNTCKPTHSHARTRRHIHTCINTGTRTHQHIIQSSARTSPALMFLKWGDDLPLTSLTLSSISCAAATLWSFIRVIVVDNGNYIHLQTLVNITHLAFLIKKTEPPPSHLITVIYSPGLRLLQTVSHPQANGKREVVFGEFSLLSIKNSNLSFYWTYVRI